jgi:hypothetical protein
LIGRRKLKSDRFSGSAERKIGARQPTLFVTARRSSVSTVVAVEAFTNDVGRV